MKMAPKIEEKQYDFKIRSITKTEREKEDLEMTKYKLVARDVDGVNELILVSASPFKGFSAKNGVINVIVRSSNKSLDEFEKKD